jgi:hypothetical protein
MTISFKAASGFEFLGLRLSTAPFFRMVCELKTQNLTLYRSGTGQN